MLNALFRGIGAATRDLVELADSTYETAKELTIDTVDSIGNIPDALAEGYASGLISDGDNKPEDGTEASKEAEVNNDPKKVFPGAE